MRRNVSLDTLVSSESVHNIFSKPNCSEVSRSNTLYHPSNTERYKNPYEALKELTRGKDKVGKDEIRYFIDTLDVSEDVKKELRRLSPFNYFGV